MSGSTGGEADASFAFPSLPAPRKLPLTAASTVTHVDDMGAAVSSAPAAPAAVFARPQQQPAAASSLPDQQPAQGFQRNKVPFEKGFSQMDWLRLTRTHPDLAGRNGGPVRKDITMQEVKQHSKPDDAWMVLDGRVYNIGPYLRYHPGGIDILLKAAGKDGSALFKKYHAWVNGHALMEKCLVGFLAA